MKYITVIIFVITIGCKSYVSSEKLVDKTSNVDKLSNTFLVGDTKSIKKAENIGGKGEFGISYCDSLRGLIDTINQDGKKMILMGLTEKEFDSIAHLNGSLKFENVQSFKSKEELDSNVFRINDSTLVYRLVGNNYDTLKDFNSSGLGVSEYIYCGFIEAINSYLFACHYYEDNGKLIINRKTGKKNKLSHHIVISADSKYMITYAWDGWIYHSGGFDLYKIQNDELNLVISYYPPDYIFEKKGFYWSFSNLFIIDKSNYIFKHQYFIIKNQNMINCYSKMKIL